MIISQTSRDALQKHLNQLAELGADRPTAETRQTAETKEVRRLELEKQLEDFGTGPGPGLIDAMRHRRLSKMQEVRLIEDVLGEIARDLSTSPGERTPASGKQAFELVGRLRDLNEIATFAPSGVPSQLSRKLGLSADEAQRLSALVSGMETEHASLVEQAETAEKEALRALLIHIGAVCRDATSKILTDSGDTVPKEAVARLRETVDQLMPQLTSEGRDRVGLGYALAESHRWEAGPESAAAIHRSIESLLGSLEILAHSDDELLLRLERGADSTSMSAELEAAMRSGRLTYGQIDEAKTRGRDFLAEQQASDLRFGRKPPEKVDHELGQHGLSRGLYTAAQWESLLAWAESFDHGPGPAPATL